MREKDKVQNILLIMLSIMAVIFVACAPSDMPEDTPKPTLSAGQKEEIMQGIEQPKLIQEYPVLTSDDLEALSQDEGEVLDKGEEEQAEAILEDDILGEASEEVVEEPEPEEATEEEVIVVPETEEVIEEPEEAEPEEETIEEEVVMADEEETSTGMIYMGTYQITAYEETGNNCANGNYPTVGYTAACNTLPFGTTVYIEGIGYRVIEDRGADWHQSNWIDVYMGDVWSCNQFGVQYLDVWVVE